MTTERTHPTLPHAPASQLTVRGYLASAILNGRLAAGSCSEGYGPNYHQEAMRRECKLAVQMADALIEELNR